MSDRKNRDRGIKMNRQKHKIYCSCWYCDKGSSKIKVIRDRMLRHSLDPLDKNSKSDLSLDELGDNDNCAEPLVETIKSMKPVRVVQT
jgi:hypothetical protein